MALKSNFEATNVISSPFVDEVANPGETGSAGIDNARAAIAREMNAARISNNADAELKRRANPTPSPAPAQSENKQEKARKQKGGNAAIVRALLSGQN